MAGHEKWSSCLEVSFPTACLIDAIRMLCFSDVYRNFQIRFGGVNGGSGIPVALLMLHSRRWAIVIFLAGLCLALYVLLPPGWFCRSVCGRYGSGGTWDTIDAHYRASDVSLVFQIDTTFLVFELMYIFLRRLRSKAV